MAGARRSTVAGARHDAAGTRTRGRRCIQTPNLAVTVPSPRSSSSSRLVVRASASSSAFSKACGPAAVAVAASAMLTGGALAQDVLLGGNGGVLAFEPNDFSVKSGELIHTTCLIKCLN